MPRPTGRYLIAPVALVAGTAGRRAAARDCLIWLLLRSSAGSSSTSRSRTSAWPRWPASPRRRSLRARALAIVATGGAGIAGLLARPDLLQLAVDLHPGWLFPVAGTAFALAVIAGVVVLRGVARASAAVLLGVRRLAALLRARLRVRLTVRRRRRDHDRARLPVPAYRRAGRRAPARARGRWWASPCSSTSRCSAGSRSTSPPPARRRPRGGGVFGAYTGLLMAHFVVDAGLWRLRDAFPREFLSARLPYLLPQPNPRAPVSPAAAGRTADARPGHAAGRDVVTSPARSCVAGQPPPHPPAAPAAGATNTTNVTTSAVTVAINASNPTRRIFLPRPRTGSTGSGPQPWPAASQPPPLRSSR